MGTLTCTQTYIYIRIVFIQLIIHMDMYDLQHTFLYRSARYDSVGAPFVGCGVGVWFEF